MAPAKAKGEPNPEGDHFPPQSMIALSVHDSAHVLITLTMHQRSRKKPNIGMISQIINDTNRPHQGNAKKIETIRRGIKNLLSLQ